MCLKRCFIVTTEIFNYRWCQNNLCRSTIEQMSCQKCSGNISPKNLVKYKYIVVFINKMKPICRIFLTCILPDHNNNVLKIGFISLYEASYFLFYMLMFLTASSRDSSTNCVNDFFVSFSQSFRRWCWTNRRSCWILDCVLCCHDKRDVQLFSLEKELHLLWH